MRPRNIKVTTYDFEHYAFSKGWIDGYIAGKRSIYVYIELGLETEYEPRPNDAPKTEYKYFYGCNVFYATSIENLEKEIFEAEEQNVTVIIYC
ncbi:MAG: hypothetical protein PUP92_00555 [Rhizonema sp. PD38]|nr:hypothetical protein [Rhizonema sp. PD38]